MNIVNDSNIDVIVKINNNKFSLAPKETTCFDAIGKIKISLSHTYQSWSMSMNDFIEDFNNDSFTHLANQSKMKPRFEVVLDCHYVLDVREESEIHIQRHFLRPCYSYSYDRLFPVCHKANIIAEDYTFTEKNDFVQMYRAASKKSTILNILKTLIIILGGMSVPTIAILMYYVGIWGLVGIIGFATVLFPLGVIYILLLAAKEYSVRDLASGFESKKIGNAFRNSFG